MHAMAVAVRRRRARLAVPRAALALLLHGAAARAQSAPPTALENAPQEVAVRGVRPASSPGSVRVGAAEGDALAGTEGDAVKAIEDLPGVARPSFGGGPVVVWGASPGNTTTFVDGVPIPALFHGQDLRSTIAGALVRDVTLTPGSYGAEFGRALGGIVRVETQDLPRQGAHGRVDADGVDGSAYGAVAIGDRVRAAVAGRYGWLDAWLHGVGASRVDEVYAVPKYMDAQAKIEVDLDEGERLDVVFLASRDDLGETVDATDASRTQRQTTQSTFERLYARYRRALDDGSSVFVVPWLGHDTSERTQVFGPRPAVLDASAWRGGLRASRRVRLAPWATVTLGADVEAASTVLSRSGSLEIPPREGDEVVFGEPPGPDYGNDSWNVGSVGAGPYAVLDLAAGPLDLSPALRFDGWVTTTSRRTPRVGETPAVGLSRFDAAVEPRMSARLRVAPRFAILASAGVYSQPPAPADASAVFGNPNLGPERAEHATLGESLRITETLTADVTAFYEWMHDLVVRDPSPTPPLAQALVQSGVGESFGVQLLLRQRPWAGFSGWVSCTLSHSTRRDAGTGWRLFDDDEPLVVAVVATKSLGDWTLGARFRFASGLPRTPVVGAFYDAKDDLFDPEFGPQNSNRLPNLWQIDLRVDRVFALGPTARAAIYLEGLNVAAHANAEDYVYSRDYTRRGVLTGLPFLASIGARVEL
jgi:hypothetical protein